MFSIHRMLFLPLKKVQIIKITSPFSPPSKKISDSKILNSLSPHWEGEIYQPSFLLTAIWKALHIVSFSLKFDPDIILTGCGLLALSRLEYYKWLFLG